MSGIRISDDGSTVVFLRGEAPNREGWSPNPSADPNGPEHAIWAARTGGGGTAWRVVDAANTFKRAARINDGELVLADGRVMSSRDAAMLALAQLQVTRSASR